MVGLTTEDEGETYYQSFLEGLSSKQVQNTDTESEDRMLELVKLKALIWDGTSNLFRKAERGLQNCRGT